MKASNGTAVFWDGIIDPAGWYNTNTGTLVNGSFSGVSGWKLNVTAGSGYTSVPTLTFASTGGIPTVAVSLKVVTFSVLAGGEYSSVPTVTLGAPNSSGLSNGGTQAQVTVNAGLKSIAVSNGPSGVTQGATVTISGGTSGTAATGTAIVSNGVLIGVTITAAGANYTGAPATLTVGGKTVTTGISATFKINSVTSTAGEGYTGVPTITVNGGKATTAATFNLSMGVAATVTSNASAAYLMPGTLAFTPGAGGTGASITLTTSTAITGTITGGTGVFTPNLGFTGFTYLDSNGLTNGRGLATFTPTANTAHSLFYQDVLAIYVQGNWTYTNPDTNIVSSYGFSSAQSRLGSYVMANGAMGQAHVQPGLDLINSSTSKNNGDITIASNWNLAAGSAFKSNGTALTATDTYNFADNYIKFIYRLGLEPGTLTLRAIRDINVNASISDGFFQFRNYNAASYLTALRAYIPTAFNSLANLRSIGSTLSATGADYYLNSFLQGLTVPVAPYSVTANATTTANGYSPSGSALAAADVFPEALRIFCTQNCGSAAVGLNTVQYPGSWSYRFTAGADLTSANPNATKSLATFSNGHGNVIVAAHESYNQPTLSVANVTSQVNVLVNLPTMLRTGTGSVDIAAARNLQLDDQVAPGVIYTAGVNTALLAADPQWNIVSTASGPTLVANNAAGFFEPQILLANIKTAVFGPPNAAAFPEMGGDITIAAQQDVIGFQNVQNFNQSGTSTQPFSQFYTPWLFATAKIGLQTGSDILKLGAGIFQPSGTTMKEQSAWWIQFGSFDQGVMSVGGNVTLTAGRDLRDFSVSLPTTGRVSGGLSVLLPNGQLNTPVPHVYGSGNMTVSVGRALASGTFYEGSGHASIQVRGSVSSDWQADANFGNKSALLAIAPVGTVLAVDLGQLALTAGGSILLSGVVNPAALRKQILSGSDVGYFMQTYGPDSAVRLYAGGGDISFVVQSGASCGSEA